MKDNIRKFLDAQNAPGYGGYANAVTELTNGKKLSHWIWYVFPQLKSISQDSLYEKKYGIENLEEAKDYLQDLTLKTRLDEVCGILMNHQGKTANNIFGMTDAAKVKSSLTLFYLASKDELYRQVLDKYYNGLPCQKTLYALNLTMPSRGTVSSQNKTQGEGEYIEPRTDRNNRTGKKQRNVTYNSKGRKSSKIRKVKKLMIIIMGIIVIVGVFGGVGFGAYMLLSQNTHEVPVAENSNPDIDNQAISDKSLAVVLRSSDRNLIGKDEMEKYFIHVSASFGDKTYVMDSVSNSYNFKFTSENYKEAIIINVTIEDCIIGKTTYVYNDLGVNNDTIKESVVLTVSGTDLRIYEELAWYLSAERQVSEAKYPKYVERIKAVEDENFATLLTEKLKSIGKVAPKTLEDKTNVIKKDGDHLPNEIMHRVRTGRRVPPSLISELSSFQRKIIEDYNWFVSERDTNRNGEILHELRYCTTFGGLQLIIKEYREWAER